MDVTRRTVLGATLLAAAASLTACSSGGSGGAGSTSGGTITVASVNNDPMIRLQKLAPAFTEATGINVKFVILTENDIRAKIQQDVAVKGGQFDVLTLSTNDAGTYLDSGWVIPLQERIDALTGSDASAADISDFIPAVLPAFSSTKNGLAALPFYSESTMIMYRKDLFEQAGLTMSESPTWDEVYANAVKLNDPQSGTVGMAIRGKAGYGENMYVFNTIMNAYGAQIVDTSWQPQYTTPEMTAAWDFYRKLQQDAGAPGASNNGYTETLNLMSSGKAAIYYDATVSADTFEADGSAVKGKLGYALSPSGPGKGNTQTVGGWGVAVPSSSKNQDAAFKFITWATSKDYVDLVAKDYGWINVPSGARTSTYQSADYQAVAPYAPLVLKSIEGVEFEHPAVGDTPYVGNSLPNIPEWAGLGQDLGALLSGYIAGDEDTSAVLQKAQATALQAMKDGGRIQ